LTAICTGLNDKGISSEMERGDFINVGGIGYEAWVKVRAALGEQVFPFRVISDPTQWMST